MILRLLTVCLLFIVGIPSYAQQSTVTANQLRIAREAMNDIEAELLRSGENQEASALILESKLADEAAYFYLIRVPGYDSAIKHDKLLDFMEETRKEYKDYRKLDKEAKKTRRKKQDHIASINEDYQKALELYEEVH